MNKIRVLMGSIGVATLIVVGVACGSGDDRGTDVPVPTPPVPTSAEGQTTAGPSTSGPVASGDDRPLLPAGAPRATLTYDGTAYYQNVLSAEEAANFTNDNLELVGSTTESNTVSPNGGEALKLYRLNGEEADNVYTLNPGQSFKNEDGTTITIEPEWVRWSPPASSVEPSSQPVASSGMMVPRPINVEQLVASAQVIVVGKVNSVIEEKRSGGYEDGKLLPAGEDGLPFTDYEVGIENVLKRDSRGITEGGTLVLRMYGHRSGQQNGAISLLAPTLPNPGDHLLFALGQNPDGTYGSGAEGLLSIDGEKVSYIDGAPFAVDLSPEQLLKEIAAVGAPVCCKP